MEGFINKIPISGNNATVGPKTWNRRYLVLENDGTMLEYLDDSKNKKAQKVDLKFSADSRLKEDMPDEDLNNKFIFVIFFSDEIAVKYSAPSMPVKNKWIRAIKTFIKANEPAPPTSHIVSQTSASEKQLAYNVLYYSKMAVKLIVKKGTELTTILCDNLTFFCQPQEFSGILLNQSRFLCFLAASHG